ncbi:MAG: DNA mismatch repair protein MutS, partial [Chloroflexi bacterium]|nr:DNA mismatch repair protein MutS [Chloroflexota bacterium]
GSQALHELANLLDPVEAVSDLIGSALSDDPPATTGTIGVIARGYSPELDAIYTASDDARQYINSLESVERKRTGIKNLKVGYNKVFGYYLEVTKANTDSVPEHYIRKQTLVNAERYITPEMKEAEVKLLNAEEEIHQIELRLYRELLGEIGTYSESLLLTARILAEVDRVGTLAEVAARHGFVRPHLTDADELYILGGRHPVVEQLLAGSDRFVPNDTTFTSEERIHVITGPNMSGKSTYLRQVALIVLLAQIGSFVPADEAHIGLVDRIFTRIGAQDEIHAGQSTFMVEMVETALILQQSTRRSLIVLDEIGRGTSTYDGLAIARAVIEYLHNHPRMGGKTLFATHYHELTELENILPGVANYSVTVAEQGEQIVFLHTIMRGKADKSYGIHVAELAGVPKAVVRRAAEILDELEAQANVWQIDGEAVREPQPGDQLSLFGGSDHPALRALKQIDVESMSPIDAITRLHELVRMVQDE